MAGFCTNCGTRIADGQRFCVKCGRELVTVAYKKTESAPEALDSGGVTQMYASSRTAGTGDPAWMPQDIIEGSSSAGVTQATVNPGDIGVTQAVNNPENIGMTQAVNMTGQTVPGGSEGTVMPPPPAVHYPAEPEVTQDSSEKPKKSAAVPILIAALVVVISVCGVLGFLLLRNRQGTDGGNGGEEELYVSNDKKPDTVDSGSGDEGSQSSGDDGKGGLAGILGGDGPEAGTDEGGSGILGGGTEGPEGTEGGDIDAPDEGTNDAPAAGDYAPGEEPWAFPEKKVNPRGIWGQIDVKEYVEPVYNVNLYLPSTLNVDFNLMRNGVDFEVDVSDSKHDSEFLCYVEYSSAVLDAVSDRGEGIYYEIQSDGLEKYNVVFETEDMGSTWINSLVQMHAEKIAKSSYLQPGTERPFYSFAVADDKAKTNDWGGYSNGEVPAFSEFTPGGVKEYTAGVDFKPDEYQLLFCYGSGSVKVSDSKGSVKEEFQIQKDVYLTPYENYITLDPGYVLTVDCADGDGMGIMLKHRDLVEREANRVYVEAPIEVKPDEGSDDGPASTEDTKKDDGQIFPDSSERLLSETEVSYLSDEELRYAINEIYARHGYIFKDEELLAYYSRYDWYVPSVPANDFSVAVFNKVEKTNVDLMKKERDSRK